MSYSVDNIISVNLILTASGIGYGDFSSALTFASQSDLVADRSFKSDTYKDYANTSEVAQDFQTTSDIYLIASRFFANIPKPKQLTVWMRAETDSAIEMVKKSNDKIWRYHYFLKNTDLTQENLLLLGDWADSSAHPIWVTTSDPSVIDVNCDNDIASVLKAKGNRHIFVGYKDPISIATDPSQAYAMIQLAAAFNKFNPIGINTSITGEYQVLPGVMGDDLSTTSYNSLKSKNVVFFTKVELAGSTDNSRVINSKTMSSYGEFIDDVINLDVLRNHLQADGYNYLANSGTKIALTTQGYAGLLSVMQNACKRFYDNGVLGSGYLTDIKTGDKTYLQFGFVIDSIPEDVLNLSSEQRKRREFPLTQIRVILGRAGHTAEINVSVE